MELHEELGAVRREALLDSDRETAWEEVRDLEWLGRDAEVVEEQAPERLVLNWADGPETLVEISLHEAAEGTRVVVVEMPMAVLRAVGPAVEAMAPRGPLALAA